MLALQVSRSFVGLHARIAFSPNKFFNRISQQAQVNFHLFFMEVPLMIHWSFAPIFQCWP